MEETTEFIQPNQLVLRQDERANVDSQVATAHAYPRNVKRAINNAIAAVTLDPVTAALCTYSVPRGGKSITGPSVYLARILAQTWGNMRIQAKIVDFTPTHVVCEGTAWDLETNVAVQIQVRRSIVGNSGRYSNDMITVTGNAGNAIALRNAVLSVIPKSIVDKVYSSALRTITGDVSDETKMMVKIKSIVEGFRDTYGVNEQEVLAAVGRVAIEHIKAEDIVTLIGIGNAIKDGDTTVDEAFRGKRKESFENPQNKAEERLIKLIKESKDLDTLKKYQMHVKTRETRDVYDEKYAELNKK